MVLAKLVPLSVSVSMSLVTELASDVTELETTDVIEPCRSWATEGTLWLFEHEINGKLLWLLKFHLAKPQG